MSRTTRGHTPSPLHLIVLLGGLALAGYAALGWTVNPLWTSMVTWFAVALIAHDLVLFPLYAAADRALVQVTGGAINFVRFPLIGSAFTFALFFPGIIKQGADTYEAATGMTQEPFLGRWLLLSAAMFGLSAFCYLSASLWRAARKPGDGR